METNNNTTKVYKVTFGQATKDFDSVNVVSKNVVALGAEQAIPVAKSCLSKKELKTLYISEIEFVCELSE